MRERGEAAPVERSSDSARPGTSEGHAAAAADRVRSMIVKLGITQAQACTQAGVPPSWLCLWLRGQDTKKKHQQATKKNHQQAMESWLSEVSESLAANADVQTSGHISGRGAQDGTAASTSSPVPSIS